MSRLLPSFGDSRRTPRWRAAALLLLSVALAPAAHAIDFDDFRDKDDGQIDLSDWLLERKGFLPVPMVITEPAVGFGLGLTAVFFRESIGEAAAKAKDSGRLVPPDIFSIGGAGTENGTRMGFGAGMVTFDEGRYRWRGGVGRVSANLDFYGIGGELGPAAYNLDGWFSSQQVMLRLGGSDWWLGGRWNVLDMKSRFALEGATGQFGELVRNSRSSGLGISLEADTRDNIFTPSRGWTGSLDLTWYDPSWGSDTRFQSHRAYVFGYWPVTPSLVLAGRIDGRVADGKVPFFMLPYVDLRGVPALRLQDRRTAVAETELRWNVTPRWAAIGFVGAARAWGTSTSFSEGAESVATGVGFRYLIARRLGLYVGVDVARSTQDQAVYLQVGSAWR